MFGFGVKRYIGVLIPIFIISDLLRIYEKITGFEKQNFYSNKKLNQHQIGEFISQGMEITRKEKYELIFKIKDMEYTLANNVIFISNR